MQDNEVSSTALGNFAEYFGTKDKYDALLAKYADVKYTVMMDGLNYKITHIGQTFVENLLK